MLRRRTLGVESLERRNLLACGSAAPIRTVTTQADVLSATDGKYSLREAILEANDDARCNVIVLPPGVYRLTRSGDGPEAGDLDIQLSSGLDLRGADPANTVIEGAWNANATPDRLIETLRGTIVTIENVTLRGGNTEFRGGAIRSLGELTLNNSVLTDNHGLWGGAISIETVAADSEVTAAITDTYLHGNSSTGHGGAISHTGGKLVLRNSTLANNDSGLRGGGMSASAGIVAITNVTFSGNNALKSGGALSVTGGSQADLVNATVYQNTARGTTAGGGLDAATPDDLITLENSIVAGNAAWHERNPNELLLAGMNLRGNVRSDGSNLFGDVLGAIAPQIRQTDLVYRNPRLEPLALNGGRTPTHALMPTSAAIGAGAKLPSTPLTDQNGVVRGDVVDIGAVESQALAGDTNADGRVDLVDLNNVRNSFGAQGSLAIGDTFPFDAVVDLDDLNRVRNNFGASRAAEFDVIDITQLSHCIDGDSTYCAISGDGLPDTWAIQYALNEARTRGEAEVFVPEGAFEAEGLELHGHALAVVGTGKLFLARNSRAEAVLTVFGELNPYGDEARLTIPSDIPTRDSFQPANWINGVTIDGFRTAPHTGSAMGLVVEGDGLLVSNVTVQNTLLDPDSAASDTAPSGINIVVRGDKNVFSSVNSLNAGHTAVRNVGDDNYYFDLLARGFGCRGFRAQIPSGAVTGGAITIIGIEGDRALDFETTSTGSQCGDSPGGQPYAPTAILVDPIPVDQQGGPQRIERFVLSNVDIGGPDEIDSRSGQGNLVKIAAVNEVLIENSTFNHTNPRLHSLRFAEANGTIEIRNSKLDRSLRFEDAEPAAKSLVMSHVTIGAGFKNEPANQRRFAIDGLRVWDYFVADHLRLEGFSVSGIDWSIPTPHSGAPISAGLVVTDSKFIGDSRGAEDRIVYALTVDPADAELACGRLRGWHGNTINNLDPNGAAEITPAGFPCNLVFNEPPSLLHAPDAIAADAAIADWHAADLLLRTALTEELPARRSASRRWSTRS